MLAFACLALAAPLQGSPMRFVRLEDFDRPGPATSWIATFFPDEIRLGDSLLTRESLTISQGAPDTMPPLPINAGGDAEGRCSEQTFGGGAYALTADTPENRLTDCAVRGFVAIGVPNPSGGQNVGLLVRVNIDPNPPFGTGLNGYMAQVSRNGSSATFELARWRGGVVTPPDVFATVPFVADFEQENYLIALHAEGDALLARLWRVRVASGALVIEPVLLGTSPKGTPTNAIVARDGELAAGRIGVYGFARGGNSVFWDDVQLGQPPDLPAPLPTRAPLPTAAPGR